MLFVMDGENNASTVKIIWFGCLAVVFVQTSELIKQIDISYFCQDVSQDYFSENEKKKEIAKLS